MCNILRIQNYVLESRIGEIVKHQFLQYTLIFFPFPHSNFLLLSGCRVGSLVQEMCFKPH